MGTDEELVPGLEHSQVHEHLDEEPGPVVCPCCRAPQDEGTRCRHCGAGLH